MNIIARILAPIKWAFGTRVRAIITIILLGTIGFFGYKTLAAPQQSVQYTTAQAQNGTLITSVTASGQITTANNISVTIQSSGVVRDVSVKNGDSVTAGETLATLTLDQVSQQKQAQAAASFLGAQNNLQNAEAKYNSLQATLFTANQKFINDAVARGLETTDPTYIVENATWLQAESDYKNQATAVSQAQTSLSSASLSLNQVSSTITAPASGTIKGLTITPGSIVTVSSSSSNSTSSSQVLGSIYEPGPIQAQVNLSEIDSVNVSEGQKVTMTLDAFPNATFTGKIASIDTNGVSSSGVTTYPAVIIFDSGNDHIYPNMGVNATIITKVDTDVLTVPSAAVQTIGGSTTVRILRNGQPQVVDVQTGDSNDTETEITSGLNEGDIVVTGQTGGTATRTGATTSPFGGGGLRFGGGFGGGAGGAARGGAGRGG
jgi:macrolide-specific efflux system membrane fusion protein